jgi:hypothetical protein
MPLLAEANFAALASDMRVATRTNPPPPPDTKKMAELKKYMPEIAARYNAHVLPPDTFDSLMSQEERELVKSANGEQFSDGSNPGGFCCGKNDFRCRVASGGIGAFYADRFAKRGYDLFLVGRDGKRCLSDRAAGSDGHTT